MLSVNRHVTLADRKQLYNNQIADQFITLVESNFHSQKPVEFYAMELGLTKELLTLGVQYHFRKSPKQILRQYLAKELMTKLSRTEIPMKDLSAQYHFQSHSQFTRFIKMMTGLTPTRYRAIKCFELQ